MGNETTQNLTTPWCISKLKIETNTNIINYKNIGDNSEKITYKMTMGFNLIKDSIEGGTYKFSTIDEKIATVSENGTVTATGIGTTFIKIHNIENNIWAAIKVNVNGKQGNTQPKVVGGYNHFVALKADGTVWGWGYNGYGQLGTKDYTNKTEPTQMIQEVENENGEKTYENVTDAIDIATGHNHTVVLKSDGTVWTTGNNGYGQLGDGTTSSRNILRKVKLNKDGEELKNIIGVTAGNVSSYALTKDGKVYSWGYNYYGSFGIGYTTSNNANCYPIQMQKVSNIIQISAGENHIALLDADGSVWQVGYNGNYQLGTNNSSNYSLPQQMLDQTGTKILYGVKEVSAGDQHTTVLKEDGTVWSTGYNGYGQLMDGTTNSKSIIVQAIDSNKNKITDAKHIKSAGYSTFVSRNKNEDGENQGLYVGGMNNYGALFTKDTSYKTYATPVETDKDILTMALTRNYDGYNTGAIVDADGMVYTAGYNAEGEIGDGTKQNTTTPTCISKVKLQATPSVINYQKAGDTGSKITCKTTAGFNLLYDKLEQTSCKFTSSNENVATVSEDGIVTATGTGKTYIKVYNQGTGAHAAVKVNVNGTQGKVYPKITAGGNFFAALKANGEIWTWGYNGYGQLGTTDKTSKLKPTKTNIYDSSDNTQKIYAIDVASGNNHTVVLKSDGTVWASGYNGYGQLGNGTTTNSNEFVQVKDSTGKGYLTDIIEIAANNCMTYALKSDGTVYSWGYNYYGNLGQGYGDNSAHTIPQKVQKVSNIIQISSGENYLAMLDADGSVWSVGYNGYGQFGTGTTGSTGVAQQMKNSNNTGILYGVKEVSAGTIHTLLAMEDGTAMSVGYNGYGQLGDGTTNTRYLPVQMIDTENNKVTDVENVSANGYSSIITRNSETPDDAGIYVTGYNNYGQLFTKNTTTRTKLEKAQTDKNIITTASTTNVSYQTSAIADSLGLVYTVGYNGNGEMGDDSTTTTINPTNISEAKFEVDDQRIILNLNSNNNQRQINAATDLGFNLLYYQVEGEQLQYKSLDTNIATVDNNGMVTAQNYGTTKIEVSTNKLPNKAIVTVEVLRKDDIAMPKVVSGQNFTIALKADGTVWAWGYNANGQLGLGDTSNRYKPTKIDIENVIDIAAGDSHTLLLTKDGKVYSCGTNSYSQLGRSGNTTKPEEVPGLENISQIAASTYNSMALTKDGKLYTWGYNGNGQLGNGTTSGTATPIKIKLDGIIKIAGKNQTSTAVTADGKLYTWGYNGYGQLGNGNTSNLYVPTEVMELENIVDVAVENNTIIALDSKGQVYSSGYNGYGNLGNNTTNGRNKFGKVIESIEEETKEPTYLSNVKQIEAGNETTIAIKKDGTAVAWGYNGYGQLSNGNTTNALLATELKYNKDGDKVDEIIDVAVSNEGTTIVRKDGKVWTVGKNNLGQVGDGSITNRTEYTCISKSRISFDKSPIRIKGIGKTEDISAKMIAGFNLLYNSVDNQKFEFSIKNSNIAQIGKNTGKVTSVKKGKTQATVTDVYSGEKSTVDVYVLGNEDLTFPQIENYNYSTVTLKANGEVWSYGYNGYGQLGTGDTSNKILPTYTGINNIVSIALGSAHTVAVDKDGHVWTWGYNNYGQLGNGTTTSSYTKVQVKSPDGEGVLENIIAVAAGDSYSLALDKDGNVYAWGYNGYGNLGLGDTNTRTLPVKVQALEKITKIEASNVSSFAIDSNNKLWVAGYNGYGNLGDGTTSNRATFTQNPILDEVADVSASPVNSTIALLLDGTVWGFGNNTYNALTNVGGAVPQQLTSEEGSLSNITAINEGYYSGYAITSEEKVVTWGLNNYAQLATGDKTTKTLATYMKDKEGQDFTDVMIVSGGTYNTEIAKNDGTVWSIGYNGYGELGDGSTNSINYLESISTQYIELAEREVTLKLSNPTYQIQPKTIYGFNLLYEEATNNGFKYVSSNTDIATVDKYTGKVNAKKEGKAYITLKSVSGEDEAVVKVNVIGEDKKTAEKVVVGNIHSLALKQDGTIWAWGDNSNGEIGNGVANSAYITEPTQVEKGEYTEVIQSTSPDGSIVTTTTKAQKTLDDIKDIAAGYYYNLALDAEGNVWAWGYNGYGQLGNGTTENKYIPTKIEKLKDIKKVYISGNTSIAINNKGEVYVWGYEYSKEPTKIKTYNKIVSASGKIMLAEDGTVWTLANNPNRIAGINNIVEVASSDNSYYALDTKGNVWAWGYNGYGQLGQGNTTNSSQPVKVQAEEITLDSEGNETKEQKTIENIVEISSGNNSIMMVSKYGEIYSCGYSANGQLGTGEYTSTIPVARKATNAKDIKLANTNTYHSIASDTSGFVYTTGYNRYGELGDGTTNTRNVFTVIGDTYVNVGSNVISVEKNETKQVNASLDNKFNLITDKVDSGNMTFMSLDTDIATVDEDGIITGKEIGKAEIVVTHKITNKTATIFVNVVPEGKQSVPKVEVGNTHTVALKADGTVWTWGNNTYGQLGTADNNAKATPVKVTALENVIDITVGNENTMAVKADGTVWSWGYNGYGQLGDGTGSNRNKPVQVIKNNGTPLTKIVKITSGNNKTIALDTEGNVWAWGYGYESTATKLSKLENIIDISADYAADQTGKVYKISDYTQIEAEKVIRISQGYNHTLFLRNDGKGYAIGNNEKGQLGQGNSKNTSKPVFIQNEYGTDAIKNIKELKAGKQFSIALMKDGTTYVWGANENYKLATTQDTNQMLPKKNDRINKAISVDAGQNNGAMINKDGFVYTWGLGKYGALGNKLYNTTDELTLVGREDVGLSSNNITIHPGEQYNLTVTNKTFNVIKDVVDNSQMNYTTGNSNIANITQNGTITGIQTGKTTIEVNKEGTDYTSIAQVTVLPENVEIEPMALTNGSHTVILKANGTVWSYGLNSSYELGNGTTKSTDIPVQVAFPENTKIKQIAIGNTHNLALDTEGNVWGWGANANYALGTTSSTPVKLGITNIKKIAANNNQSMALTKDGYVYVWGLNANGELGTRTYQNVQEPTMLPYVSDILDISMGKNHTLLLTTSGKVLASGLNVYGQTSNAEGKTNKFEEIKLNELIGKISAGDNHSVLLTTKGEIYTFGYNVKGQLGNGNNKNTNIPTKVSGIRDIMDISAGKNQTIILSSNKILYSTGSNEQGELGIGTDENKVLFTQIKTIDNMMSISSGNTYNVAIRYDGEVYAWGDYYHGIQNIKTKTNSRIPVKIGNDSSYANEKEITLNVNSSKQIEITPKYTFNVFKEDEMYNDFSYETINEEIAKVNAKGTITGQKVGTTWVKATEKATGKENVIIVRVIEEGQKVAPEISGGDNYATVLKSDGSAWGFGYNSDGQLGNDKLIPTNIPSQTNILSTYKKIDTGKGFTVAIREDGTVWAWGDNTYGVLGQGNRAPAKKPIQVQSLENIVDIAAGENHVIALDSQGKLYTWGLNSSGQLGNGETKTVTIPETINGVGNEIISIAAAGNMTSIVDSTGKVYVFGDNTSEQIAKHVYNKDKYGQLIQPATNLYYTQPQVVYDTENTVKVECMKNAIVVLKTDGSTEKIYKYAKEEEKQQEKIATEGIVDINSTDESAMLLDKDGNAYTYGNNKNGQAGIGINTSTEKTQKITTPEKQYIGLGAGYKNNYVIDAQGFVYAAGNNEYGQLGNSTYDDSFNFTLVGDRNFKIIPEARTMKQPEEEKVSLQTNIFNVFNNETKKLTDYEWSSSNTDVATAENGVITAQDMGEATITATDKTTGAKATALRVVQPLDEQRIDTIYVNGKTANLVGENKYGVSVVANRDGTGTIKITTKDATDSISIDQGATYVTGTLMQDVKLDTNPKIVKIRVKASNGKIVDFILTIDVVSENAGLKNLTINGVEATSIGAKEYEIIIPNSTVKPEITAITQHSNAKVSIDNGAREIKQTTKTVDMQTKNKKVIPIEVTAESGNIVEYTLTIYKEDALTELDNVKVDGVEATKISRDTYKAIIEADQETSEICATSLYKTAEVQINNLGTETNVTTKIISTLKEQTIVKIYVTAKENEREYTLIIDKKGTENNLGLLAVTVNGTVINPIGNIYNAYIGQNAKTAEITAVTINDGDLVSIGEQTSEVHTTTAQVELDGDTTYKIIVTDPNDAENKKEYTVNIKKPSADVSIKSITVGNSEFSKIAKRVEGTNIYEVSIPEEYQEIEVIGVTNYELAYISANEEEYEQNTTQRTITVSNNPTTIKINVRAQNGDIEEYTLKINRQNGNKNLKKVTVDGKEATLSKTEKDTYEYTLDKLTNKVNIGAITEEEKTKVGINTYEKEQNATYRDVEMQGKSIVTYITAESEDGTQKEYKLIVYALPDNIKLSSVKVNGKEAEAVPTNKYETRINKEETSFEVYVIPEDPKAKVQIEESPEVVGTSSATIMKNAETVKVQIKVTAQDGTVEHYELSVGNKSDDCKLAMIKVDNEVIEANKKDGKFYVNKKYATKSVDVEAIANNKLAKVSINDSVAEFEKQKSNVTTPDDINYIVVKITAEDGTSKQYEVVVNKLSNNTKLEANITMVNNNQTETKQITFDENNKATVKIGNNESVDLTGILKDTLATISINGSLKEQGKATKTIVTTEEQTSATIEVTAQDGTQENYTVTLVRNSSNNILESISAKGLTAENILKTAENSYTIELPDTMQNVEITAKAQNEFATVKIGQNEYSTTNTAKATIETQTDTQKFNITVKAENGEENTYEITINKVTDLGITSIKANDVECEKENGTYITYIDKGVTEVGLTIVPNNPIALVSTKVGTDDFSKAEANNTHIINIPITKEETTILIKVQDPKDENRTKTYSVIIKEKSHEADLETIKVDNKEAINMNNEYYATTTTTATNANVYIKATESHAKVKIETIGEETGSIQKEIQLSGDKKTKLKITITAQDGETSKSYILEIERKSTDTTCQITINNTKPDEYDSSTNTYTKYIERNKDESSVEVVTTSDSATVEIAGETATQVLSKTISTANEKTTVDIIVKAESGESTTYHVNIIKYSTDNTIASIKVNGKVVKEQDGKYAVQVSDNGNDEQEAEIEVISNNEKAKVQIGDGTEWFENIANSTVTFKDGKRVIKLNINIKPQDPDTQTQTKELEITLVSNDNRIKSVKNGEKQITEYDAETHTYTEYIKKDVEDITLAIESNSKYTTIKSGESEGKGLLSIGNINTKDKDEVTVTFTAISETGREQEYTVKIYKMSDNANAEHIYVDGKDIINNFTGDTEIPTYIMSISKEKSNVQIKAITENKYATIKIGDEEIETATATKNIKLSLSDSSITVPILITSQDGTTTKTYNIILVRLSDNTKIQWLEVNGKHIIENENGDYETTVKASEETAKVKIATEDVLAKVTMGGSEEVGELEETIILPETGDTIKTITVTAQDGTVTTHKLIIHKQVNDLGLKEVYLNNRKATQIDETTFEIDVMKGTTTATIQGIASKKTEYVSIQDNSKTIAENTYNNCNISSKEIKLKVTAMFGEAGKQELDQEKDYKLIIKEVEEPDIIKDLKATIKIDNEEITPDEDEHYIKVLPSNTDNVTVWAGINSETSKVKIKDSNSETEYQNPTVEKNISLQNSTEEVTVTVQNGEKTEKEYVIYLIKDNEPLEEAGLKQIFADSKEIEKEEDGTYTVYVPKSSTSVNLRAVPEYKYAKVSINDNNWTVGTNTDIVEIGTEKTKTIFVKVKSVSGTIKQYVVNIVREPDPLELKQIYVDNRIATKVNDTEYTIDIVKTKTNIDIKAILFNQTEEYASIYDNNPELGISTYKAYSIANGYTIKITASNGTDKTDANYKEKVYTLNITTVDKVEELSDLQLTISVNNKKVEPQEDGLYLIYVDKDDKQANVKAESTSKTTKVKIGDNEYTILKAEKTVTLDGKTTILKILAQNGAGDTVEKELWIIKGKESISGKVITQAVDQTKQNATITIYKAGTTEIVKQTNIEPDGTFAIEVEPDTYDFVVTKESYLEYKVTNIIVSRGRDIVLDDISIYAGDIVKDGEIEIDDVVALKENYGSIDDNNKNEKAKYDLNEDGIVNNLDRNILKANYNKKDTEIEWVDPESQIVATSLEQDNLILPLNCKYTITSSYGTRKHPTTGVVKKHTGIDIAGTHHAQVLAVADGEVTFAGVQNGFGNCIEIKHIVNGETIYSFYAHLSKLNVKAGDKVSQGTVIGLEGGDPESDPNPGNSTGHHLHFEIRNASGYGNDVDPTNYIKF